MNKRLLFLFCLFSSTYLHAADRIFGIAGDAGKVTKSQNLVRESLKTGGVLDLIMPGDNLYTSDYESTWFGWIRDDFQFEVTAIGNHHAGYANEVRFFQMPGEFFSRVYDERTRFIVLNSDNEKTIKEQMAFLDKELSSAEEPFIFLVYHHPSFTVSHLHRWQEKKSFQTAVRQRLNKYRSKITGVIVGHDHAAMAVEFGDLPVIVSGAGHEIRVDFPINNVQENVPVVTRWYFDWVPYWAKLTLPEVGDEAAVEFVRASDNQVRCTVRLKTGQPMTLDDDCAQKN
ncbi:MAG: hypothetical protein V4655_06335 [Bdellovibrionota bacterium]